MVHTLHAPRHEELSFGGMETGAGICGAMSKPYSCKGCVWCLVGVCALYGHKKAPLG